MPLTNRDITDGVCRHRPLLDVLLGSESSSVLPASIFLCTDQTKTFLGILLTTSRRWGLPFVAHTDIGVWLAHWVPGKCLASQIRKHYISTVSRQGKGSHFCTTLMWDQNECVSQFGSHVSPGKNKWKKKKKQGKNKPKESVFLNPLLS